MLESWNCSVEQGGSAIRQEAVELVQDGKHFGPGGGEAPGGGLARHGKGSNLQPGLAIQ